ncbi:MAG: hypothetical protein UY03_C0001G0047 [Parcubacteria group bacterium GW2011_GWA2_47_64]|nr:MAG: hypothetical protein UY03_C0001G0047 [Parcubacteria group bacterium GW2011_GWA2_47_64]KKU96193.1 MAG: hypothetical protein UY29_C0015G0033 [Parcubacteria group bacterium GW2011_GWC2_48_17]
MKLIVTATTPSASHRFAALLHAHSSSRTFFLDPNTFYKKWGKKVPRRHHEIEILEPSIEILLAQKLHVHKSDKSSNLFVCYPLAIRTPETAMELFRVWCAGVVLTWECRVDLNTIYSQECKDDEEKFFRVLMRRYKITVGGVVTE